MPSFTGAALSLQSVAQTGAALLRVRFTQDPLAASPAGLHDALNPINWALAGPAYNGVVSVATTGDPQGFDLTLAAALVTGTYTLTVSNVRTAQGDLLVAPTSLTFEAKLALQEPVSMGAVSDDAEAVLRKNLHPALRGPAWDALVAAVATGDQDNWDNARKAFDQLFTSTASGVYLTRRGADSGVEKPQNVGMPDDLFRQYVILRSTGGLTEDALLGLLEVFYGVDAVRARAQTENAQPYALGDQDDLSVVVDGRLVVPVVFSSADFALIGQATAAEVAAAITRACEAAGSTAYALPVVDPVDGQTRVRLYSGALGLASSVRVTGGRAQNALSFPHQLAITSGLPTWTITVNVAAGTTRFQATGEVDLSQLRVGDYVNVFGAPFLAANRGSFPVTDVYYAFSPGLVQWFEVLLAGTPQGPFVQATAGDVRYFRPVRQTTYTEPGRSVVVASLGDEVDVVLPATSAAVVRQAPHAAYAQVAPPLPAVSGLVRDSSGLVAVHAPGHGLSVGSQVFVDGAYASLTPPAVNPGDGATTTDARNVSVAAQLAAMPQKMYNHAACKLADGRVLLAGGQGAGNVIQAAAVVFGVTASAVLPDGSTQYTYLWTPANPMALSVRNHTLTLLPSKLVLKAGGRHASAASTDCELFDPAGLSWSATGSLNNARYRHIAVTLQDGRVLAIAGVGAGNVATATCEAYDHNAGAWANVASMNVARFYHSAVLLADGRVLVFGGLDDSGNSLNSAEIYDPAGDAWAFAGPMTYVRVAAGAVLLPGGRVLAVGGIGHEPTQDPFDVDLTTCEVYDVAANRWRPGPPLVNPHAEPGVAYLPALNKVYAWGDEFSAIEVLDLDRMVWTSSFASFPDPRTGTLGTVMDNGAVLLSGGSSGGVNTKVSFLLSPSGEVFCAGGLNGQQVVAGVPDADHFTYRTQVAAYTAAANPAGVTVTPAAATPAPAGAPGPFTYDPDAGLAVTGTKSTTTQALAAGEQYGSVSVADASRFPDEPGWLVFAFGYAGQQGPVPYLGRLSATALALDFSYRFTAEVPSGATVTRLARQGGFVPEHPEEAGSFYLTASSAGRVAAQAAVEATVAAGIPLRQTVVYPGDRGLGGEGLPAGGAGKLSDKVSVWAGDDVDAEVEAARED